MFFYCCDRGYVNRPAALIAVNVSIGSAPNVFFSKDTTTTNLTLRSLSDGLIVEELEVG